MFYEIPQSLTAEIDELYGFIKRHLAGELDAASLKSRRVPFGCYEQRRDGTFMLRIRATGGAITPAQLRAIAEISAQYGAPTFHITTRQEFQIHDVALENIATAMRALLAAGLSTRGGGGNTVRNITLSPDAGVGPGEVFDPSPHAFSLTTRLIAESDSWNMPRKLKIAFSNSHADTAFALFNDLGFVARIEDGRKGFEVFIAGGLGGKPELGHRLFEFIPERDVYVVAETVKRLFDKHGNRKNRNMARLRFLWRKLGEAAFRDLYAREEALVRADRPANFVPSQPGQGARAEIAPAAVDDPAFDLWKTRFVEAQRQPGLASILIPTSLGNINNGDAAQLADFLEPLGPHVVRATFGQNIRLRNIPEDLLGNVWLLVRAFDPLAVQPRLIAAATACTGADTCKLGICRPKGALTAVIQKLVVSGLKLDDIPGFRLNISGCPNTCGQHLLADLGFYGNAGRREGGSGKRIYPAYAIVAGARTGAGRARLAKAFGKIPARDLPRFVTDLLARWLEKKDRFASFADYVDGEGADDIVEIQNRYPDVPDFLINRDYYSDWGSDELFSLVGRGVGECSAGLFDLIDIDLTEADRLREALLDEAGDTQLAYQLAVRACHALLITRGIDVSRDEDVFANFLKHFVAAGLISSRFEAIVTAARERQSGVLLAGRAELFALLDEIKALYTSMDNSLRFSAELAEAPVRQVEEVRV